MSGAERRPGGGTPTLEQVRLFQEIGRRLDLKGFVASNDGNLSVRETDGSFLVTAAGARKGHLRPDEVLRVDASGRPLHGTRGPSSETAMHLAIYRVRSDIGAIVHAHPPVATGFAVAGEPMDACVLPEIILTLGQVPVAPYGTPGTGEIGASLLPVIRDHDVVLLANHGAVALGPDLEEAYFRMERLEHTARILLAARLLGRIESLDRSTVERLLATDPAQAGGPIRCVPRPAPGSEDRARPGLANGEATEYRGPLGSGIRPGGPGPAESPKTPSESSVGLQGEAERHRLAAIVAEVLKERGLIP